MDTKNLPIAVVGIAVSILIVASILVPVVAESQSEDVLLNNVTVSTATFRLDGLDDYTYESAATYTDFKINGEKVDKRNWDGITTILITDKCRVDVSGRYFSLYDETGVRDNQSDGTVKKVVMSYTASTKTFTYTVYTDMTGETVDYTTSYVVENIVYPIPNGDYGAINTGGDPDVTYLANDLSQVIAGGAYTSGDLDTSYFAEGKTIYLGNASYTATVTATTSKYQDYTDVISGSGFTISVTDGNTTETFTPYTVFVPLKVIGHTPYQNTINSLINVIPLIVIVGIVVATVGIIAYRRS